jgi:hypothetical protein
VTSVKAVCREIEVISDRSRIPPGSKSPLTQSDTGVKIPTLSQKTREGWGTPEPTSLQLGEDFQNYGGDVVMGSGAVGKSQQSAEEVIQRLGGRLGVTLGPELKHAGGTELDSCRIE